MEVLRGKACKAGVKVSTSPESGCEQDWRVTNFGGKGNK
jgi:hypothetical protein